MSSEALIGQRFTIPFYLALFSLQSVLNEWKSRMEFCGKALHTYICIKTSAGTKFLYKKKQISNSKKVNIVRLTKQGYICVSRSMTAEHFIFSSSSFVHFILHVLISGYCYFCNAHKFSRPIFIDSKK